ncbi:hypothetical protein DRJ48_04495 [Candidatus Woesearchaeota archaeon]|nr:MAG: hypothetical protein DRJ48_04495 [Candidatus Woesearchaeota archaeon]
MRGLIERMRGVHPKIIPLRKSVGKPIRYTLATLATLATLWSFSPNLPARAEQVDPWAFRGEETVFEESVRRGFEATVGGLELSLDYLPTSFEEGGIISRGLITLADVSLVAPSGPIFKESGEIVEHHLSPVFRACGGITSGSKLLDENVLGVYNDSLISSGLGVRYVNVSQEGVENGGKLSLWLLEMGASFAWLGHNEVYGGINIPTQNKSGPGIWLKGMGSVLTIDTLIQLFGEFEATQLNLSTGGRSIPEAKETRVRFGLGGALEFPNFGGYLTFKRAITLIGQEPPMGGYVGEGGILWYLNQGSGRGQFGLGLGVRAMETHKPRPVLLLGYRGGPNWPAGFRVGLLMDKNQPRAYITINTPL